MSFFWALLYPCYSGCTNFQRGEAGYGVTLFGAFWDAFGSPGVASLAIVWTLFGHCLDLFSHCPSRPMFLLPCLLFSSFSLTPEALCSSKKCAISRPTQHPRVTRVAMLELGKRSVMLDFVQFTLCQGLPMRLRGGSRARGLSNPFPK